MSAGRRFVELLGACPLGTANVSPKPQLCRIYLNTAGFCPEYIYAGERFVQRYRACPIKHKRLSRICFFAGWVSECRVAVRLHPTRGRPVHQRVFGSVQFQRRSRRRNSEDHLVGSRRSDYFVKHRNYCMCSVRFNLNEDPSAGT